MARAAAAAWAARICAVAVLAAACGGGPAAEPPAVEPAEPARPIAPMPDPPPPIIWEVPISAADIGGHLIDSPFAAGLPEWLAALDSPVLSALPARALGEAGAAFSPSAGSETRETMWVHVFTDRSAASAAAWVEALAAEGPAIALRFTSPQHELFGAEARRPPAAGGAAASMELLHGHSGGRWRTRVIVFAADTAVVFLKASRREDADSLTDLDAAALLAGERLAAARAAARGGG